MRVRILSSREKPFILQTYSIDMTNKIFGIGFHKTGTKSLAKALRILGYRVTGPNGVHDPDICNNVHELAKSLVPRYDAFQDNPWPILYREMDAQFPGSKFILTIRSSSSWIQSQVGHFGADETPMREWIYGVGSPKGHEEIYIRRYEQHNREVLEYFNERKEDLLVMDLSRGDGWDNLCEFLSCPVPHINFPHANKSEDRKRTKRSFWDFF